MTAKARHIAHKSKPSTYIEGLGWRHTTEHRMTRWPRWKDSHMPGTYMLTLNVNNGLKLLGTLKGCTAAVYNWMKNHKDIVAEASHDKLYYRHAILGTRTMPFVLKENKETDSKTITTAIPTSANKAPVPSTSTAPTQAPLSNAPHSKPHTHFPIAALHQPDAPHIELSPLGETVKAAWERMPQVMPQIEQVCLAIMPNHLHAIIAVKKELPKSIGSVIRSFMGTTTHAMHKMIKEGTIQWSPLHNDITAIKSSCDGVSTPSSKTTPQKTTPPKATPPKNTPLQKPSLWTSGYCTGICNTEEKLHTRIGYVLENPFFGILEKEQPYFMERNMQLTIAGRRYCGYGNILLLKEPDRMQIFCHRQHPTTREPYHQTQDFQEDKQTALDAAADGIVIVTPGISPGEAEIMWAVLKAGGNVINIQKEIPFNDKWHPDKERRLYCQRGTLLVIAAHDIPNNEFYDSHGLIIPNHTLYSQFHNLNAIAEELCCEGIEHECRISHIKTKP